MTDRSLQELIKCSKKRHPLKPKKQRPPLPSWEIARRKKAMEIIRLGKILDANYNFYEPKSNQ